MMNDPYHYKSKFVITVLAIFVVLLAYGYLSAPKAIETTVNNEQTANHNAENERIFNEAVFSSDTNKCNELSGVQKNNCIYAIISRRAVDQDRPEICDEYPDIKQQCIDYYETEKAKSSGTCESVSDKDTCYFNLAISKWDESYCSNIENTVRIS